MSILPLSDIYEKNGLLLRARDGLDAVIIHDFLSSNRLYHFSRNIPDKIDQITSQTIIMMRVQNDSGNLNTDSGYCYFAKLAELLQVSSVIPSTSGPNEVFMDNHRLSRRQGG